MNFFNRKTNTSGVAVGRRATAAAAAAATPTAKKPVRANTVAAASVSAQPSLPATTVSARSQLSSIGTSQPPSPSWLELRAFSGRAVTRQAMSVFVLIFFISNAVWGYAFTWVMNQNTELAKQQWLVYEVPPDGATRVRSASEFRTGALDQEIRGTAWNAVRFYYGADSSNYQTYFAEFQTMLSEQMKREFSSARAERIEELKRLNLYRKIENGRIRPLTRADLPANSQVEITRYDVVVEGKLDQYRRANGERIASGPFAYYVQLAPTEERTETNMQGLQVVAMAELKVRPENDRLAEPNNQRSTDDES